MPGEDSKALMGTGHVEVTQADREAAARFMGQAWHLFWPGAFEKAVEQAKEIEAGYCDDWLLVQSFSRHRLRASPVPEGQVGELQKRLRKYGDDPKYNGLPVSDALHAAADLITNLQSRIARLEEAGFLAGWDAALEWEDPDAIWNDARGKKRALTEWRAARERTAIVPLPEQEGERR